MRVKTVIKELKEVNIDFKIIFDKDFEEGSTIVLAGWLEQNLSISFSNIYSYPTEKGGVITNIKLLENNHGERCGIVIKLFDRYMGQFTSICPQIIGCVSQGNSRQEALKNLCVALAESTILNRDVLDINPFTSIAVESTFKHLEDETDTVTPAFMCWFLKTEFGINNIWLSKNNIIMKHSDYPSLTFVIPLQEINAYTRWTILLLAQHYIGGSKMMKMYGY